MARVKAYIRKGGLFLKRCASLLFSYDENGQICIIKHKRSLCFHMLELRVSPSISGLIKSITKHMYFPHIITPEREAQSTSDYVLKHYLQGVTCLYLLNLLQQLHAIWGCYVKGINADLNFVAHNDTPSLLKKTCTDVQLYAKV